MKKTLPARAALVQDRHLHAVTGAGTLRCLCSYEGRTIVYSPGCPVAGHAEAAGGGGGW